MRKNTLLKVCSLMLAGAMVIGTTGGCASKETTPQKDNKVETTSQANGEKTAEGSPQSMTDISVMLYDRGNIPADQGTIDNNRWTQYINEKVNPMGLKVKFIPVPRSDEGQKIPVMMSSGTAADVMMSYQRSVVQKFYEDGGLWDLNEYIDQYGPNLKKYIGEEHMRAGLTDDGKQFAIPVRRSNTARTNVFIRKDWLDKLGMAVPTTPDELYDVLYAFKYKNPDGLDPNDVIAFQQFNPSKEELTNAFWKETDERSMFIYGGGIETSSYAAGDPGFRDYARFRNKLYNDGLMDPEYFTDLGYGKKASELFVKGKLGYYEYHVNGNVDSIRGSLLQTLKQNVPTADMISIPPMKNVNDGKIYNNEDVMAAYLFVPKTAKDPGACIRYLDWLATMEGGFTIYHGFEGEHFKKENNVPVVIDPKKNIEEKDWIRDDLFLIGNGGYFMTDAEFKACKEKEIPGYEEYVKSNYENAMVGERYPTFTYLSPTQIKESTNIIKVNAEYSVKTTTCKPEEFDNMFEEWVSTLERYSIREIQKERTEYYDNVFSKQ